MKTRFLFIAAMLISLCLNAQEKGWAGGGYGFFGTAGFGYPTIDPEGNAGPAYQVGVLAQYSFGNRLALRTGVIFSSAKGTVSGKEPDYEYPGFPTLHGDRYEARIKHTDLVLPVELLIDLGQKRDRGVYALLGPAFGIALKRHAVKTTYVYGAGSYDSNLEGDNPAVDLYTSLGLGYALPLNSGARLYVQLTGSSNAMSSLASGLSDSPGEIGRARVNWYGLGVGVMGW